MGVDKPWCGGVVRVKTERLEEARQGLEKVVGEAYDISVGIYEDFVYAKGIYYESFYDRILIYFEFLEASGYADGEPVLTRSYYGYFLNVREWIETVKEEHFREEDG